jgi:DNA-binding response OmpR family regulator
MVKKILIVDDEKDLTEFLRLNLESTNKYKVKVITDSTKAVSMVKEFEPDLIILDEIMPKLDGSAIAAVLGGDEQLKSIPIIFLTAAITEEETRSHSGIIGEHVFIAKPASVNTIIERIESILEG